MIENFRLNVFKKASLCRNFEEEAFKYIQKGIFKYPLYLSAGEEFISATLSEIFSEDTPMIFAQHRGHSTYLSFGGNPIELIDELLGKESGCCKGMGGSASIQSKKIGMYGHDGLMGSEVPIAVGACFASNKFTITFMGDAAAEEDYVLSSIGWASSKRLPMIFVVEDNNLSILTQKSVRRSWEMNSVAEGFGMKGIMVDDEPLKILEVLDAAQYELPMLLNIKTERLYWHAGAGIDPYEKRDRYEIEMREIGQEAKDIHFSTKEYIEKLWKERLEIQ
jgi:TPP-dependent pyruvate/acetoin dehydrogenase alpha subunit